MSLDMEMLKRFSYGNSIDSIFECDKVDYILIGANCVRPNAILYEKRIAREITMVEHDRRSDMQHKKNAKSRKMVQVRSNLIPRSSILSIDSSKLNAHH